MEFIKSKLSNYIIVFLAGFLSCLYLTKKHCVETPQKSSVIDSGGWIEHHRDTIYYTNNIVPESKIIYKYINKEMLKTDSPRIVLTDSLVKNFVNTNKTIDDSLIFATINHYQDSTITEDYKLIWTAETFGILTSMVSEVEVYKDTIIKPINDFISQKPKWAVNLGISTQFNYKTGVFFKGWGIEAEFKPSQNKLSQIYFTKQITF